MWAPKYCSLGLHYANISHQRCSEWWTLWHIVLQQQPVYSLPFHSVPLVLCFIVGTIIWRSSPSFFHTLLTRLSGLFN